MKSVPRFGACCPRRRLSDVPPEHRDVGRRAQLLSTHSWASDAAARSCGGCIRRPGPPGGQRTLNQFDRAELIADEHFYRSLCALTARVKRRPHQPFGARFFEIFGKPWGGCLPHPRSSDSLDPFRRFRAGAEAAVQSATTVPHRAHYLKIQPIATAGGPTASRLQSTA
jgi:hypothetical protein